jgi:hypothetical protein
MAVDIGGMNADQRAMLSQYGLLSRSRTTRRMSNWHRRQHLFRWRRRGEGWANVWGS